MWAYWQQHGFLFGWLVFFFIFLTAWFYAQINFKHCLMQRRDWEESPIALHATCLYSLESENYQLGNSQ